MRSPRARNNRCRKCWRKSGGWRHRFRERVGGHKLPLVELTGGEPLLQTNALPLMKTLCDEGFTVLIETSGAQDISEVDSARAADHGFEMPEQRRSARAIAGRI